MGLLLDDLFLLHDEVLPDHFYLPQRLVYGFYGAFALGYLIRFAKTIATSDYLLLGFAFVFFGFSMIIDTLPYDEYYFDFIAVGFRGRHLMEDGAKLLGIVSWSAYFVRFSWFRIRATRG